MVFSWSDPVFPKSKKLRKAISVSLLNQIVSSGTNFILGIYLVRLLSPIEFGLYGIGSAISLFYSGIGNALFLTQMVVRIPDKTPSDRLPYTTRILILTIIFSTASALAAVILLSLSSILIKTTGSYSNLGLAITSLATTYLLKDFFIRHAYSMYKEKRALIINISLATSLLSILFLQSYSQLDITASRALFSVSIAQAIAMCVGFRLAKLPIKGITLRQIAHDLKELFQGGKWSVVAHIIISIRGQAYTLIVATLMGPAGVARLNAAKIFITPATMLMPALGQVFLPRIARTRATDPRQGFKIGLVFSIIMLGIVLVYSTILLSTFQYISIAVIGSKYQSLFWLVFWWSIYNCLITLRNGQELIIVAYKLFRTQALINGIAAFVAVVSSYFLFLKFAEPGAIIGLIVSEVVVLLLMWRITKTELQNAK